MKKLLFLWLAMLLAFPAFAQVKIGSKAPLFELPGNDGKTYRLSQLQGKYVVLEWFNNECPYVDKHYNETHRNMQNLQRFWTKKNKKAEVVWLTIVSSAPGKQGHVTAQQASQIKNNVRKAYMNAILLDPQGKVGRMYGAKTTPHMYIIDPQGVLQYKGAIDNKPSARLASLSGAKNYVHKGLGELFAGKKITEASTKPYGCSVKY